MSDNSICVAEPGLNTSAPFASLTVLPSTPNGPTLVSLLQEQNEKLNQLLQQMTGRINFLQTRTPKKTKEEYVIVLRKNEKEVRVVERDEREGKAGSAPVGRRVWKSEKAAWSFWRKLATDVKYKWRQEREGWAISVELYDPKKHKNLPTQFRADKVEA